tara:strand:- start:91 stop:627 length:537 start_codon:yes stop_codon:yes gene_type:complete
VHVGSSNTYGRKYNQENSGGPVDAVRYPKQSTRNVHGKPQHKRDRTENGPPFAAGPLGFCAAGKDRVDAERDAGLGVLNIHKEAPHGQGFNEKGGIANKAHSLSFKKWREIGCVAINNLVDDKLGKIVNHFCHNPFNHEANGSKRGTSVVAYEYTDKKKDNNEENPHGVALLHSTVPN